jgi:ADP-heptose:LPS heptosyltransferase
MQNTKCLIVTCGFFGDIMFASSIAEKLRSQYQVIDYLIGFPQMHRLIQNNPYIDNVYLSNDATILTSDEIDYSIYDDIYTPTEIFFNEKVHAKIRI